MLVKNLTTGSLKLRKGNYKKVLLPMQITVVDEFKMPPEYIKKVYGSYVQIMAEDSKTEVVDANNLPDENKGDLETQKDNGALQPSDGTSTEEEKGEADDNKGGSADINSEDTDNDNSSSDKDGSEAGEEGKKDAEGKEPEADEEPKEEKTTKKKGGRKKK